MDERFSRILRDAGTSTEEIDKKSKIIAKDIVSIMEAHRANPLMMLTATGLILSALLEPLPKTMRAALLDALVDTIVNPNE